MLYSVLKSLTRQNVERLRRLHLRFTKSLRRRDGGLKLLRYESLILFFVHSYQS